MTIGYNSADTVQHEEITFKTERENYRISGGSLVSQLDSTGAPIARIAAVPENSLAYRAAIQALISSNPNAMAAIIERDGRQPADGLCLLVAYKPEYSAETRKAGLVSFPITEIKK